MWKKLINLGFISTIAGVSANINQLSDNNQALISNEILKKNVDNFQQLSKYQFLTTDKVGTYKNEEAYVVNVANHQKTDLNINVLCGSDWSIGNNRFIASDGFGNSYIYLIQEGKIISKTPINFLKGTAIIYSQKISENIYVVSFPDENMHSTSAIVNFSDINNLKYTELPGNPFITNGNPIYVINEHSFIISVTANSDWLSCDISDFNNPVIYSLFDAPSIVLSSINNYSQNQLLVTVNNNSTNTYVTQLWTINNKNPKLWIKEIINDIIIKNFIMIAPNLAIVGIENQSGLFLLDYSNWNDLKLTAITNSQTIEMLDISLYPFNNLIIMDKKIIFNDYANNQIKILDFYNINSITISPLNITLGTFFSGFYQIVKINEHQFMLVDKKQDLELITL